MIFADNSKLKHNFKALRVNADLTQEQIAKKLGIARTTFLTYENNASTITVDMLFKMAYYYGCHITDFFKNF